MSFPPFPHPMMGRGTSALFVGAVGQALNSGANSVALPAGAKVGDFVLAVMTRNQTGVTAISGAVSWSGLNNTTSNDMNYASGLVTSLLSVSLTSTSSSTEAVMLLVFRGAGAVALKGDAAGIGTSNTIPGFTKAPGTKMIVSVDGDMGGNLQSISSPGGFTIVSGAVAARQMRAGYLPPGSYANGTNIVWTATNGVTSDAAAFELT